MKLFAIFFITLLTVSLVSGSCTLSKAGRCAQDFGRNSHRAMGNKKLVCQFCAIKLNCSIKCHNCNKWACQKLHTTVEHPVNLPGVTVWAAKDNREPASCTSYHINPKFCLELVVHRTMSNDLVIKWWFHKRSTSWTLPTDLNPGWRAAREFQACIHNLGECRGMPKNVIDRTIKKIIDSGCKLHSGTTIQKAQVISVLLPSLLLGHYLQSQI